MGFFCGTITRYKSDKGILLHFFVIYIVTIYLFFLAG
jgi:hypothetical protein